VKGEIKRRLIDDGQNEKAVSVGTNKKFLEEGVERVPCKARDSIKSRNSATYLFI
jgi:hypothetical protein